MSTPNDGGPAFPETRWDDKTRQEVQWCGMTLRDYLAAHASEDDIKEFIPQTQGACSLFHKDHGFWPTRYWARYAHADAMLIERAK